MNTKKDGPGKDGGKPAEASGAKKPYATLDLKATEIKTEGKDAKADPKAEPGKSDAGKAEPAKSDAASGKTATTAPAAKDAAKPATPAAGADAKPSVGPSKPDTAPAKPGDKPAAGQTPSGAVKPPPGPPPAAAPRARSGFGSFLSHLAAGIVGGFLALLGADTIGQQLGLPVAGGGAEATSELKQRLASLERSVKTRSGQSDLAGKLAAVEARLQKMDEVARSVSALGEAQAKLAADAQAVAGKVGGQADVSSRVGKLEDTLATIAAAATSDPQAGRVPQLAAITGKLKDLEGTIATQMTTLRKGIAAEVDTRIAQTAEASEAAKAGTQRIDREMAAVKTDAARLTQRVEALKADGERLGQTLRVVQEEAGSLKSGLDALKGDFDARLKSVARADDVSGAVAPVASKLAALETSIQSVVKSEQDRKANAERIVLALELNNLKRAIDRGQKFAPELGEVKKVGGSKLDLAALDTYKDAGVPTLASLAQEFRPLAHKIIEADAEPAGASVVDKLLAGAKSVVRVRKTSAKPDDKSVEGVVARMDAALKDGRLLAVQEEAKSLSAKALAPAEAWLSKVAARSAADRAIAAIEAELKSSLGGAPAPAKASN